MNSESTTPRPPILADELAGAWFELGELNSHLVLKLDLEGKRRFAQLLLLDGLIRTKFADPIVETNALNKSLQALRHASTAMPVLSDSTPSVRTRTAVLRRSWIVAVAASALLLIALFAVPGSPATANAMLKAAQREADKPIGRAYEVVISLWSGEKRVGSLFVEGQNKFAFRSPAPFGNAAVGSNGTESWFVPAIGPVTVRAKPHVDQAWTDDMNIDSEFLQMVTVIHRIRDRYEYNLVKAKSGEQNEANSHRIDAARKATVATGPDEITVWINPQTYNVESLELRWLHRQIWRPQTVSLRLTNELVGETSFEHESYHEKSRRIIERKESGETAHD